MTPLIAVCSSRHIQDVTSYHRQLKVQRNSTCKTCNYTIINAALALGGGYCVRPIHERPYVHHLNRVQASNPSCTPPSLYSRTSTETRKPELEFNVSCSCPSLICDSRGDSSWKPGWLRESDLFDSTIILVYGEFDSSRAVDPWETPSWECCLRLEA